VTLAVAVVAAVGSLNAGTIQTQINLSAASLGTTGNQGGWNLKNYDTFLFAGANNGAPTVPYTGYQQYNAENGVLPGTVSPPVTFNMINSGCSGVTAGVANTCNGTSTNSNNAWVAPINSAGETSDITIPVGIFDVTDVWTMINNLFGTPGSMDTTVIFNWGASATVTNGTSLTVNLTNASNNAMQNSGEVRTAIDCTSPGGVGTSTCNTLAIGGLATGITGPSGITIDTGNVFTQSYNSTIPGSSMFAGSTGGNLNLDDQGFIFNGLNSGLYLVNIEVMEDVGKSATSDTVLSGVTVDSVTPEPSTIWLGLAGFVAMFVWARRRRVA